MTRSTGLAFGRGLPPFEAFEAAARDGWIWTRTLTLPNGQILWLANYTKDCQYKRHWTEVTRIARGLIVNLTTGEIVALPLEKFFNLGEQIADGLTATARSGPFEVLVKMDGSLGIGYRFDGRLRWATRGSFASDQSVIAETMWGEQHRKVEQLFFGEFNHITPMAEIIHPDTRVVVRYNFQGLVLIAARNRFTGDDLTYEELAHVAERTGMRLVERWPSTSVEEVIARVATLNDNEEGVVLRWPGYRTKAKGKEYLRLHKVLTGVTPAHLVQSWQNNERDHMLTGVPEEFRLDYEALFAELDDNVVALLDETDSVYRQAPPGDKRVFARWVATQPGTLRAPLYSRRHMEAREFAVKLARDTIAALLVEGKLPAMLRQIDAAALQTACAQFEARVGQYLWDVTRTAESRAPLARMLPRFPQAPRSVLGTTLEMMQPDLVLAKLSRYLVQPEQQAALNGLTVEGIFANAAPPESRMDVHLAWVFSLPLPLRSMLNRWRESGRRDTTDERARALLAAAIASETTAEVEKLLADSLADSPSLDELLAPVISRLVDVWNSIPLAGGPRGALDGAHAETTGWATALLYQAWYHERTKVAGRFLESGKTIRPATEAA
ncbi:MAG: T4 RnlA family RNA ligase [Candidatus Obscuribacterales bacterium]|nr:T4 RnlA family RNA ligase [Candidatus Obscuribacterales bacterium]